MRKYVYDNNNYNKPQANGCLGFGDFVQQYVKYGYAREIEKGYAIDMLAENHDKGSVHTIYHERDDAGLPVLGICSCCWDCCGFFKTYNYGAGPFKYKCYYHAEIAVIDKCTGCGKCEKYCPTAAILIKAKKVNVNKKRCIGCGQCSHQCPSGTMVMRHEDRIVYLPILKRSEARLKG